MEKWLESVYSDGTAEFVSNPSPKLNEIVKIRIRMYEDAPVKHVLIRSLPNGAEGFMHVRTLEDWFEYDERKMTLRGERTGAVFSLGQALSVRVEDVELTSGSIDLALTAPLRGPNSRREKSEKKKERERMRAFSR